MACFQVALRHLELHAREDRLHLGAVDPALLRRCGDAKTGKSVQTDSRPPAAGLRRGRTPRRQIARPRPMRRLRDLRIRARGDGGNGSDLPAPTQRLCLGQKPPILSVKSPTRPYKSATQNRSTADNAKGA
jgi:hypothetical protein